MQSRTGAARTTPSVFAIAIGLNAMGLTVGCSTVAPLNSGAACVRTLECAAGLVCREGRCSSDLNGFGVGMVPMDAGMEDVGADGGLDAELDGAMVDADLPDADLDAGPPIDANVDAFALDVGTLDTGVDAFVEDTGSVDAAAPVDAGRDAFAVDAFAVDAAPRPDAFVPTDAFTGTDAAVADDAFVGPDAI